MYRKWQIYKNITENRDMRCTVAEFVREAPIILDEKASVAEGAKLMSERNMGAVLVVRADEVVGLFTEQDLVRRVAMRGLNPTEVPLGEVCTRKLVSVSSQASCREALLKMRANRCRRLLVYQDSRFTGLVELPDIAHSLAIQENRKDWLPNIIVKLTLILVLVVIGLLILTLPGVIDIALRVHP
jgi:signal-transduction protein with cAMP-binding, CBS, and nucleotidyltransferase domain